MFGITNPADLVNAGTIIGAALLALLGRRVGDVLKATAAPEAAAPATPIVPMEILSRIASSMESIALCMKMLLEEQRDQHRRDTDERLERMEKLLADKK